MHGTVAALAAAGALLIPSSSGPSNTKLQHQITRLQTQMAEMRCRTYVLDQRVTLLEQRPAVPPTGAANVIPPPGAPGDC